MKPPIRKLLIPAAAIGLLGAAGWYWFGSSHALQYRTVRVDEGSIDSAISATGSANAVVMVQVGSQVSGNIRELYADFNTKVKKGQLVARIDPEIFQAKVDQARASYDAAQSAALNMQATIQKTLADVDGAKAAVENAKAGVMKAQVAVQDGQNKLNRANLLFDAKILAVQDHETAQSTYATVVAELNAAKAQEQASESSMLAAQAQVQVARTQLAQAQATVKQNAANLAQAQVDLDHTYIKAPVDGTVVARHMDVGQTVAASFSAPTIFDIAQDLTRMQVDTNVDEADIGRVRTGQNAAFRVDAYPGTRFQGNVVEIRKAPNNVQNVITYDVVVAVSNPDLKLFPGMTANVSILADHQDHVLRLPNAALRFRPAEQVRPATVHAAGKSSPDQQTVWVLGQDGKPRPVRVKLGITDGSYSQVVSGDLKPGDQVILSAGGSKTPAAAGAPNSAARRGPAF